MNAVLLCTGVVRHYMRVPCALVVVHNRQAVHTHTVHCVQAR